MKKSIFFLELLVSIVFFSCSSGDVIQPEYVPFTSSHNGRYGMIGYDGEILFEDEFTHRPTPVLNGRFFVSNKTGNIEIYTAEEKPLQIGDEYLDVCPFTADVTPAVKPLSHVSLIDKTGKEIVTIDKIEGKKVQSVSCFHEGVAIIKTEDGMGCIDINGKLIIPIKYHSIYPCSDGLILAISNRDYEKAKDNPNISVLKKNGEISCTINKKYQILASEFKCGCLPVAIIDGDEEKCGFIDSEGKEKIRPTSKIKRIIDWKEDSFIYSDGENCGVMTYKDKHPLIRPKYSYLAYASDNLLWAYSQNDQTVMAKLLSLEGDCISDEEYHTGTPFNGNFAFVQISENEWGIIDREGREQSLDVDIYSIDLDLQQDKWVGSDYVDIDAVLADAQITKNGAGKMSINDPTETLVKKWIQESHSDIEANPKNFIYEHSLSYDKEIEGVYISYKVHWSDVYIAKRENHYDEENWSYSSSYHWTEQRPNYIKVHFSGSRLDGRENFLYSKLLTQLKTMGKVYKSEKDATIISITDQLGMALSYGEGCVDLLIIGHWIYKHIDLDEWAENPDIEKYDYVEADTVAVDTEW